MEVLFTHAQQLLREDPGHNSGHAIKKNFTFTQDTALFKPPLVLLIEEIYHFIGRTIKNK